MDLFLNIRFCGTKTAKSLTSVLYAAVFWVMLALAEGGSDLLLLTTSVTGTDSLGIGYLRNS